MVIHDGDRIRQEGFRPDGVNSTFCAHSTSFPGGGRNAKQASQVFQVQGCAEVRAHPVEKRNKTRTGIANGKGRLPKPALKCRNAAQTLDEQCTRFSLLTNVSFFNVHLDWEACSDSDFPREREMGVGPVGEAPRLGPEWSILPRIPIGPRRCCTLAAWRRHRKAKPLVQLHRSG